MADRATQRPDLTTHAEPPKSRLFATGTGGKKQVFWRWVLTLGPVALGAWVSLYGRTDLAPATRRLLERNVVGGVDCTTVLFWTLALLWTWALYVRLREEDEAEERYRADLKKALFHLPNLDALWNYWTYHDAVVDMALEHVQTTDRDTLGEALREALVAISKLAQTFARNPTASYGASIMLIVNREKIPLLPAPMRTAHRTDGDPVEDGHPDGFLRFGGYRTDVGKLDGLLVLPQDLALMQIPEPGGDAGDEKQTRSYPLISLPIRRNPSSSILPGAPTAVLSTRLSAYRDTRTLADRYGKGFSEATREEVRTYFAPGGEGEAVRSIAAIRIDNDRRAVGVLNIDTDVPNVLGPEPDYHHTFSALLRPLLRLLAPLVDAYAVAWWSEIIEEHEREEAHPHAQPVEPTE